eukprot:TRINITY_DN3049_c0_g1_i4.p2 TRINITY_DN3049_c0_g1~~TRINITY_DN3049_c0_g1_i4.p2  ORF type:complete len:153 (+),score=12.92 TRINITY_DN3049_c0_g1_i4:684-1142(+)
MAGLVTAVVFCVLVVGRLIARWLFWSAGGVGVCGRLVQAGSFLSVERRWCPFVGNAGVCTLSVQVGPSPLSRVGCAGQSSTLASEVVQGVSVPPFSSLRVGGTRRSTVLALAVVQRISVRSCCCVSAVLLGEWCWRRRLSGACQSVFIGARR